MGEHDAKQLRQVLRELETDRQQQIQADRRDIRAAEGENQLLEDALKCLCLSEQEHGSQRQLMEKLTDLEEQARVTS